VFVQKRHAVRRTAGERRSPFAEPSGPYFLMLITWGWVTVLSPSTPNSRP
jgi:hypothetical protein